MNPRTAALPMTAFGTRALSTGHLLADCERWCREALPPRVVRLTAREPVHPHG